MQMFKSSFRKNSILFGIGLTILGTLMAPLLRKKRRTISVKKKGEPLMSENMFTGTKEKMSGMIDKIKEKNMEEEKPVTRKEFIQLKDEVRKEREQLEEILSILNKINSEYKIQT